MYLLFTYIHKIWEEGISGHYWILHVAESFKNHLPEKVLFEHSWREEKREKQKKFFIRQNSQRRKDIDWTFSAAHSLLFRWKNSINTVEQSWTRVVVFIKKEAVPDWWQHWHLLNTIQTKPVTMTWLEITHSPLNWSYSLFPIKLIMSYHSPAKDFILETSEILNSIFGSLWFQIKEFQSEVALFWHNLHHPIKHIKEASSQIREVQ